MKRKMVLLLFMDTKNYRGNNPNIYINIICTVNNKVGFLKFKIYKVEAGAILLF
jgi:hypothetical protein